MARNEQDRGDLLAEARALVERVELRCTSFEDNIVLGFRRDGCASFYFGQQRAYHFNAQRQLRRAYNAGQLFKAERGQLVSLIRQRQAHEVQLLRHNLTDVETREFLDRAWQDLQTLAAAIAEENLEIVGCIPIDADVVGRAARWLSDLWLADLKQTITVADGPEVR